MLLYIYRKRFKRFDLQFKISFSCSIRCLDYLKIEEMFYSAPIVYIFYFTPLISLDLRTGQEELWRGGSSRRVSGVRAREGGRAGGLGASQDAREHREGSSTQRRTHAVHPTAAVVTAKYLPEKVGTVLLKDAYSFGRN